MGKQWKQWQTLFFLCSKITADVDCSHEIKRHLLLGRKAMTNLDSILKSRDITLPTKVHLVKAMVFQVVRYGCESWTIKKAEAKELMLLNFGVGEDSFWKSLGLFSLAWRIPWRERPGGLQPMGSQRVRHEGATNAFPFSSCLKSPSSDSSLLEG